MITKSGQAWALYAFLKLFDGYHPVLDFGLYKYSVRNMREPRIYVDLALQCEITLALPETAVHHVSRVLRMRSNQQLWLFNGLGGSYRARIIAIGKHQLMVKILDFSDEQRESTLSITLAQGISRAQHMEYTVQKAVELGVNRIVPIIAEFGNVQLDRQRRERRLRHWRKIIISACEQCGRNIVPEIDMPISLGDWLEADRNATRLLLSPGAGRRLSSVQPGGASLSLLSGPEGGFSPAEVLQACGTDYVAVELGPRVLRTETAAVAAISACQTLWGDMG